MSQGNSLFKASIILFYNLLRAQIGALAVLFIVGTLITFELEDTMINLGPTEETLRLTLNLSAGLIDLFSGVFLILLLSWGAYKVHPLKGPKFLEKPFDRPYLRSFFAEYMRMIGRILLWALLLIIPGFIVYIRLSFVPFITLFSRAYDNDEVDALQLSGSLFKRCAVVLGIVLVLSLITQGSLELASHFRPELHAFPVRFALNLISFLISIWTYSFIFLLFAREMEKPDGINV